MSRESDGGESRTDGVKVNEKRMKGRNRVSTCSASPPSGTAAVGKRAGVAHPEE